MLGKWFAHLIGRTGAPTAVTNLEPVGPNADEFGSQRVVITDPATGVEFGTGALPVQGTVAHDAVDAGNPLLLGGRAVTGIPADVQDGDRVRLFVDERGVAAVKLVSPTDGNDVDNNQLNADGLAATLRTLVTLAAQYLFNGTTWDRRRNNAVVAVRASAALTATTDSADQTNQNGKGLVSHLDITAVSGTTPTLDITFREVNEPSGALENWLDDAGTVIAYAQKTAAGRDSLRIHPGIIQKKTGGNRQYDSVPPRRYDQNYAIGGTTPSFTFAVSDIQIM